jgi:hypothetical protein
MEELEFPPILVDQRSLHTEELGAVEVHPFLDLLPQQVAVAALMPIQEYLEVLVVVVVIPQPLEEQAR